MRNSEKRETHYRKLKKVERRHYFKAMKISKELFDIHDLKDNPYK